MVVEKLKPKQITLYFQRGRVCQINFGPLAGKLCVIIDFVDQARALVDGPFDLTGVHRQTMMYRRLSLTTILLDIPRSPLTPKLIRLCKEQGMMESWKEHPWCKREVRVANKAKLSDFDRFKISKLKIQRHAMIKERLKIVDRNHKWRKKTLNLFRRPGSVTKRPCTRKRNALKKAGKWPPKAGEDDRWPEGYARKMTEEHKKAIAQWRLDKKEKLKKIRAFRHFKTKILKRQKDQKRIVRKQVELEKFRKRNKEKLKARGKRRLAAVQSTPKFMQRIKRKEKAARRAAHEIKTKEAAARREAEKKSKK